MWKRKTIDYGTASKLSRCVEICIKGHALVRILGMGPETGSLSCQQQQLAAFNRKIHMADGCSPFWLCGQTRATSGQPAREPAVDALSLHDLCLIVLPGQKKRREKRAETEWRLLSDRSYLHRARHRRVGLTNTWLRLILSLIRDFWPRDVETGVA